MAVRTLAHDDPQRQLADADRAWSEVRRAPGASPTQVRDAAATLIVAARLTGRYREALHVGKDAGALLSERGPEELAFVEAHVCLALLDAGDVAEAERWMQRALSRPRKKSDDVTGAALARAEGNLHLTGRRWREARACFERHARLAVDPLEQTIAKYNVGEACIRLGLLDDARAYFEEIIPQKTALHDRWGLAYSHWGRGICHLGGRPTANPLAALDDAERGLVFAKQMADPKIGSRLRTLQARCLCALKRLSPAEEAARDAVREAARAGPRERADGQLALAEVLLALGQGRRATHSAETAADIADKAGGLDDVAEEARRTAAHARTISIGEDSGPRPRPEGLRTDPRTDPGGRKA